MTDTRESQGAFVVVAASLLSMVLGSVHAFSVFLVPLEAQFGAGRSEVSLIYSGALIFVTLAVLVGHRVYARAPAARLVLAAGFLGALGALIAGYAPSLPFVWLGYCVLFGVANGLGYGFGLQIAAQVNPGREGLAMGTVTAAYALGAVLSPALFARGVEAGGFRLAMEGLAACLMGAGCLSALMMARAGARCSTDGLADENTGADAHSPRLVLLWVTYFGGVMAGLMVIGHAAAIAAEAEGARALWLAPALLAVCNLAGSLTGGRWADGYSPRRVLSLLSGLTVLALLGLAAVQGFAPVLLCLCLIGFAYGGTIAAHPAYIAKRYGRRSSARVYGRIFTAWGAAGLAGPWLAGLLYDARGDYLFAVLIAACFGLMSIVTAQRFYRPR